MTLKSGQLAQQAGVTVETLRYYEREGVLPIPPKTEAGYRLYPPSELLRIRFIKKAQELGFTLKEIKELLALNTLPQHSAKEVKELAAHKITVIDEKIATLQAMRHTLMALTNACLGDGDSIDTCPIIQCLNDTPAKGGDTV